MSSRRGGPPRGRWPGRQLRSLGVAWLVQSVTGLTALAFGPLAPFLSNELGLTKAQIGLLVGALPVTSLVLLIPSGLAVDRIGEKAGMIIGQATIGVWIAAGALAPSYYVLLLFVTLAGLGTNFTLPSTTKAIVTWFVTMSRATAMGIKQTGYNAGGVIASVVLPIAALAGGFRLALLVVGGFALAAAGVSALVYPTYRSPTIQPPVGPPLREALDFLANPRALLIALAAAAFNAAQTSLLTYIVLYLNAVVLLPVLVASTYLAVLQVTGALSRIGWGFISDRVLHGRRIETLQLIAVGIVASSVAIAALNAQTPSIAVAVVVLFAGVLFLGWPGVYLAVAGEIGGQRLAGGSVGVIASLANVGMLVGPPLFGYIVDSTGTYTPAWVFLAATMVIGLVALSLARRQ